MKERLRPLPVSGDYVLSLKGNRGCLQDAVSTYFTSLLSPDAAMVTIDGGHGRIETRAVHESEDTRYFVSSLSVTLRFRSKMLVKMRAKVGVRTKRLKASWDNNYLLRVIGAI